MISKSYGVKSIIRFVRYSSDECHNDKPRRRIQRDHYARESTHAGGAYADEQLKQSFFGTCRYSANIALAPVHFLH
jgi:hypothetical protein